MCNSKTSYSDDCHFCVPFFYDGKCVINLLTFTTLLLSLEWKKVVATRLLSQSLSLHLHRFVSCSSMEHKLLMKTSKKISLHFYAHEFWGFQELCTLWSNNKNKLFFTHIK